MTCPVSTRSRCNVAGEVTPFTAPTQRPDEPVTSGIDLGPGVGSEALRPGPSRTNLIDDMRRQAVETGSPDALFLYQLARQGGWL